MRLHGRAVTDLLHAGHDDALARLQTGPHDVIVANDLADGNRLLTRHEALPGGLRHEHEVRAADPVDRDDRNRQRRIVGPDDPRARVLQHTERRGLIAQLRLHQHRLRRIVRARRDEGDRVVGEDGPAVVQQLHRQPGSQVAGALQRHRDVRLQPLR